MMIKKRYGVLSFKRIEIKISKSYKQEIYRKAIHLSSLWIPALIYFYGNSTAFMVFLFLMCGEVSLEYGNYKKWPWARMVFSYATLGLLRRNERQHEYFQLTGGFFILASALMCSLFFSNVIAIISLIVMIISDTSAALVGKAYGQCEIYKKKTLEGSMAFFLTALMVMILFNPLFSFGVAGVIACLVATFAELFEKWFGIDDNFSIPLIIGFILTIVPFNPI